jgi:hypothetical protein
LWEVTGIGEGGTVAGLRMGKWERKVGKLALYLS